jgi:hypothetical protein
MRSAHYPFDALPGCRSASQRGPSRADEARPGRLLVKYGIEGQPDCRCHLSEALIIDLMRCERLLIVKAFLSIDDPNYVGSRV